jgi:hypothetical protein
MRRRDGDSDTGQSVRGAVGVRFSNAFRDSLGNAFRDSLGNAFPDP